MGGRKVSTGVDLVAQLVAPVMTPQGERGYSGIGGIGLRIGGKAGGRRTGPFRVAAQQPLRDVFQITTP